MSISEYLHLSAIFQLLVTLLRQFFHFSSLQPIVEFWTPSETQSLSNLAAEISPIIINLSHSSPDLDKLYLVTRVTWQSQCHEILEQNWSRDGTGDSNQYFTTVLNSYKSFQARCVTDCVSRPLIGRWGSWLASDWSPRSPLTMWGPGLKVMVTQWSRPRAGACKMFIFMT